MKLVANNKKARHDYFIEETYEAGISLTGTEIKSVRQGKVSIKESYAKIVDEEVIIYRYAEDEEGAPILDNIESDEEFEAVSKVFDQMLEDASEEE